MPMTITVAPGALFRIAVTGRGILGACGSDTADVVDIVHLDFAGAPQPGRHYSRRSSEPIFSAL
jgi:hypothetical protein